ncbi:hypothetical protein KCU90_g62, partial [Aureobasidium melanogenum]
MKPPILLCPWRTWLSSDSGRASVSSQACGRSAWMSAGIITGTAGEFDVLEHLLQVPRCHHTLPFRHCPERVE